MFLIIELLCTDSITVPLRLLTVVTHYSLDDERSPDVACSLMRASVSVCVLCFALISEE